jgi:hypothetical protein
VATSCGWQGDLSLLSCGRDGEEKGEATSLASMEVGGGVWGVGAGWRSKAEWGDIDEKSDQVNLKLIGWADYWAGPSLFPPFFSHPK